MTPEYFANLALGIKFVRLTNTSEYLWKATSTRGVDEQGETIVIPGYEKVLALRKFTKSSSK